VDSKNQQMNGEYQPEELLYALLSIQQPVALANLDGTIKWVNVALEQFYGYSQGELKGKKITSLYSNESRKTLPKIQEVISKDGWYGDLICRRKDKTLFPVCVTLRIVRDEKGEPLSLVKITQEISPQKVLEKHLIQSEKLIAIGTLAAGIAHELNQPLMVIRGYTQILLSSYPEDPELKDTLKRIERQTTRMIKIIQHLREFSRGSDGVKKPVDINEIIKNAFTLFDQQLKAHDIQVTMELAENLPFVNANFNRLEQVIVNLIVNARDALDEKGGGEIKVINRLKNPHELEILFSDTGIGIPAHVRQRIFEPFFTTKEAEKGTGLGLSISYGIVKEHGGDISVDSKKGKGTTFTITLPVHKSMLEEIKCNP